MASERRLRRALLAAAAALGVVAAVAALVRWSGRPPEGPVPVAWDRVACAECNMLVSEPAFAAQLHTHDAVHHFDDPGCLFRFEDREGPQVRARWFHHLREERWIPGDAVAFVPTEPTPMGYGLGAVTEGNGAALSPEAAREHARARDRARMEAPR